MRINKKKKVTPKTILLPISVVIILAIAVIYYAFSIRDTANEQPTKEQPVSKEVSINPSPTTDKQTLKEGSESKTNLLNEKNKDEKTVEQKQEPAQEEEPLEILVSQNGDGLSVSTKLTTLTHGQCSIKVIQNNNTIFTDNADILYNQNYSTCLGFSVPSEKLSNGTAVIDITATNDKKNINKKIEFEVQ